jgi:hypothetical protein
MPTKNLQRGPPEKGLRKAPEHPDRVQARRRDALAARNAFAASLVLEMMGRTPEAGEKYLQGQLHRREVQALRSKGARRRIVQDDTRALELHIRRGLHVVVATYPFQNEKLISRWRQEIATILGPTSALLDADRIAHWKEWLFANDQEYRRSLDPDQIALRREEMANFQPQMQLRWSASETLHISLWDGVDGLAARFRSAFDAIPPSALVIDPNVSDREAFKRALDICARIVGLAILDGRTDLESLFFSLHAGLFAINERDRGFDEPLLRPRPRSPDMPRETEYARHIKAWCAMACQALIRLGVRRQDAAFWVASVLNRNQFLPPKSHNGKSATARSILNWEARLMADKLPMVGIPVIEFRNAFNLRDKGQLNEARQEVLRVLTNHLGEVKSSDLETSTPS